MTRWSLAIALPILASVACSPATDEVTDDDGLVPSGGIDASIVALVSPNKATWVCSGVAIAPRVILSAGHCFSGGNSDKTGWTFDAVVGADVHLPEKGDRRVHVTAFRLHPDYHPETGEVRADGSDADIAVAFVDCDLGVTPMAVAFNPLPTDLGGRRGRYGGFGRAPDGTNGNRHIEAAEVKALAPDVVEMTSARIPCHGDSGGPLILTLDGEDTVVGLGHTVFEGENNDCFGPATYTRTDLFADFIRGALSKG